MADRFVNIEHSKTGENYAVRESDFKKGAEDTYKGYKILSYEGGEPYEGPKTAAAISRAQDAPAKAEAGAETPKKDAG